MNIAAQKAKLRACNRAKIASLITPHERNKASISASKIFFNSALYHNSNHIACYYAQPHEIDTIAIITQIQQAKKYCYLPCVAPNKTDKILKFSLYLPHDALHYNRYKIFESQNIINVAITQLDLLILPMVAFDKCGTRLGSGAGFYDQTLAQLTPHSAKKLILLGLAYTQQELTYIPKQQFDIPVDYILTEKNLFKCPQNAAAR